MALRWRCADDDLARVDALSHAATLPLRRAVHHLGRHHDRAPVAGRRPARRRRPRRLRRVAAVRAAVLLRGDPRLRPRLLLERGARCPGWSAGSSTAPRRWTRCSARASAATRSPARRWRPRPGTSRRTAGAPGSPRCSAERLGVRPAASIPCGVALGISAGPLDRDARRWIERRARPTATGGSRSRSRPGWDAEPVAPARARARGHRHPAHRGRQRRLRVARRTRPALRALDDAGLLYIEQPLAPDELVGHARLSQTLRTPVCVDETLHGAPRRAAAAGARRARASGT